MSGPGVPQQAAPPARAAEPDAPSPQHEAQTYEAQPHDVSTAQAREAFIRANTKLMAPPLVPEIVLHLAEESVPLWQKTEEALAALNVPPPFWAFAWAGGQALARYVLDHADLVRSKRVLDLGAGGGLAALAAAKAGACRVIAADVDPFCAPACRLNAAANDVTLATHSGDLLAGDVVPPDADVVLVADLFYERAMAQAVLHFIDQAHRRGARVLIGDPSRSYFPVDRFTQLATYNVAVTRELEDMDIKRTSVWSP